MRSPVSLLSAYKHGCGVSRSCSRLADLSVTRLPGGRTIKSAPLLTHSAMIDLLGAALAAISALARPTATVDRGARRSRSLP